MRDIAFSDLDLLSLNILVNLYESKSATSVSHKLNIPAPKISRCLKHARELFGNELFIRKKYGLVPNEFAGKIYPIAKEIVECSKSLQKLHCENSVELTHHFEIASPDLISYTFPKVLLTSIRNAGKDMSFNISTCTRKSIDSIVTGEVDIGLCCCNIIDDIKNIDENLEAIPLKKLNKLFLICHHEHPILKQEITLESIAEYPFVNVNVDDTKQKRSPFQAYCDANNIQLNTEMDLSSLSGIFEYLRSTQAVALLPYSSIYNMINSTHNLHACRISDVESERLYMQIKVPTLYLVYNKTKAEPNLQWLSTQIQGLVNTALH
ncbi:LysR family transcriptional regulator [Shewanella canadensis]|uniref:LysR family transcriptional regulator n=1 Tax=Shewanella canadensis TaxID=271096 RepID=A0A431WQY0_9GAMM|nr:LysR family transcriptional regulator [Shewanella canadensis]RTR38128.1 LysR family transcriptional regulator [Shewanella canadensis]